MSCLRDRATTLLERLEASQIPLVEWETSLWIRLGYPLVWNGSLLLLVPDDQLQAIRDLAADVGLCPTNEDILRSVYPCETSHHAVRFLIDDSTWIDGPPRRRLVFLPMSWTGITCEELVSPSAEDGSQKYPPLPSSIQTVPLSAACAALVRIAIRQPRGSLSRVRTDVNESLVSVIGYGLFDMSYEGNYMEFPPDEQPLSDAEILEIESAVAEMNKWAFRNDEEWIREILIQITTGKKSYDDLPWLEDSSM